MKNKFLHLFLPFLLVVFVWSCSNGNSENEIDVTMENADSVVVEEEMFVDTLPEEGLTSEQELAKELIEEQRKEKDIHRKFESGLTFCDCVKKQDSLNKKLLDAEEDSEIRQLQEAMKKLMTGECKEFLATNQVTKEDKEAHQRKVKACLGGK